MVQQENDATDNLCPRQNVILLRDLPFFKGGIKMHIKYKSLIAICLILFIFISAILGIVVFKRNQYLSIFDSDSIVPVSYELYFASLPENQKVDVDFGEISGMISAFFVLFMVFVCINTKEYFEEKNQNKTMKNMMVVLLQ